MSKDFEQTDFLFAGNSVFVEELYQLYLANPNSVDPSWQKYFASIGAREAGALKSTAKVILPEALVKDTSKAQAVNKSQAVVSSSEIELALKAKFMIAAYRSRGHYLAALDPLNMEKLKTKEELKLTLEDFGLTQDDLQKPLRLGDEFLHLSNKYTVSELVNILRRVYSGSVAAEFNHVENLTEQQWLFEKLELSSLQNNLQDIDKKTALQDLVEVEGFEQYLHTKFPGAKRFSIEGGDSSIVAMIRAIDLSAAQGVKDIVIGMAHRGRLCTLTKVMGKPYRAVLSEFMGTSAFPDDLEVAGDVKYHMGYSSDKTTAEGEVVHLSLTPNPSHLEAVNPVVAGKVRAKQDLIQDNNRKEVMGILVHGDAAFCGQGVVAESLVMSGLEPYDVGGILHFVVNNQVGFTANPSDARPGRYATEVAKMVGAPILHVNGDDIEAVLKVAQIAINYRNVFGKDIIIDIVCYRKYGHNEGDEPMYTQGQMYNVIKTKQTPGSMYAESLVKQGVIDDAYFTKLKEKFKAELDAEYEQAKTYKPRVQWLEGMWAGYTRFTDSQLPTGVKSSKLKELGQKLCQIPSDFSLNPKLAKLFDQRAVDLAKDQPIDWATGEQLAFASLLVEGVPIRLTGQDCGRGTFSHRHSVLHSQVDSSVYLPLNNLSNQQASYFVADSNLSEYGVLGFEYGYSLVSPKHLVMWEAQFGDFANGAQIVFDQFISSSETKWLRMSGLVMLLPHGFEGQGPEHSSARLERFLQLAAEDNIQVAYPTTPASLFHLLRRQIYRNIRKPLIIMSPKSLLRHKLAVSHLNELDEGTMFKPVLDEVEQVKAESVARVILCSGKVYYDLVEKRASEKLTNIAIIRLEQLYPFAEDVVINLLTKYNCAKEFIWCQEEPKNMGAWSFIKDYLSDSMQKAGIKNSFKCISRVSAASPAVGSLYAHNKQQDKLVKSALIG